MSLLRHRFYFFCMAFLVAVTASVSTPSMALDSSCSSNADCPRNYRCASTPGGSKVCVWDTNHGCSFNGDCPTGSTCVNGTCSSHQGGDSCRSNGDCGTGDVCCSGHCRRSHCMESDESNSFNFDEYETQYE